MFLPYILPENTRKPLVLWYFQGCKKGKLARNGLSMITMG